jgi:hypothetical protein
MEKLYCHSYNTISVPRFGKLLISSLDNTITLYFLLSYLRGIDDLELVKRLGNNKVDCTVGSALDIFGGELSYSSVIDWHNRSK